MVEEFIVVCYLGIIKKYFFSVVWYFLGIAIVYYYIYGFLANNRQELEKRYYNFIRII